MVEKSSYLRLGVPLPSGLDYPTLASFIAPDMPFLESALGLYVFDGNNELSRRNLVNADLPLTTYGTPDYSGDGVVVNKQNGFDTGISGKIDITAVAILAGVAGTYDPNVIVLSNWDVGANRPSIVSAGDILRIQKSGSIYQVAQYVDVGTGNPSAVYSNPPAPGAGWWSLLSAIKGSAQTATGIPTVRGHGFAGANSLAVGEVATTVPRAAAPNSHYFIGGGTPGNNSTAVTSFRLKMLAIYGRSLSEAESGQVLNQMRTVVGPSFGIEGL